LMPGELPPVDPYTEKANGAGAEGEAYAAAVKAAKGPQPTANDPLRGLVHLSKVAVVGRGALVALSELAIAYAWEPVARPGWLVMLGGGVGSGKTSLVFLLVAARLNLGAPVSVLGRRVEPAPKGRWLVLIEGEVDDVATAKKLRKSMQMLGVDESALDRVIVVARKGVVVGDETWGDIEKLIALDLVSDVVIDTLARATRADSNDEQEQAAVFERVTRSVQLANPDERPIVWVVGHTRKGDGIEIEDIAGSSQRVAQMDSVLMVRAAKTPAGKVVSSTVYFKKLRHDPDDHPEPVTMTLDRDPATGQARCTVDISADDDRPLETRLLDILERQGPLTRKDIVGALGRNPVDVQSAIDTLFAAGRLCGAKVKRRNGQQYSAIDVKRGPRVPQELSPEPRS
jgi:hypothetical protein